MRSLAKIFHKKQKHHDFVRSEIVKELKRNPQTYIRYGLIFYPWISNRRLYDNYVDSMSEDKYWGDSVTLYAAPNLYHVRILVFSSLPDETMFEVRPHNCMYKTDIYLSYHYENEKYAHYNPAFLNTRMPAVDSSESSPSDVRSSLELLHAHKNNVRLFVENLHYNVTGWRLGAKFSEHGKVLNTNVVYRQDGRSCGFAFVVVENESDIERVIEALDGKKFEGRRIYITRANEFSPYEYIE